MSRITVNKPTATANNTDIVSGDNNKPTTQRASKYYRYTSDHQDLEISNYYEL